MATTPRRPRTATCEASGRWVPATLDDGAWGTCPLCLRIHARTKAGRLRAHVRKWPHPMTYDEVFDRLQGIRRS